MTTEFVTAAAIVGLVGGVLGVISFVLTIALNGWNLADRIQASKAARQAKKDEWSGVGRP